MGKGRLQVDGFTIKKGDDLLTKDTDYSIDAVNSKIVVFYEYLAAYNDDEDNADQDLVLTVKFDDVTEDTDADVTITITDTESEDSKAVRAELANIVSTATQFENISVTTNDDAAALKNAIIAAAQSIVGNEFTVTAPNENWGDIALTVGTHTVTVKFTVTKGDDESAIAHTQRNAISIEYTVEQA